MAIAALLLSACATPSDDIVAISTPLSPYQPMSCAELAVEGSRLVDQIALKSAAIDRNNGSDRMAMGVGVVFWPALFLIDGKGDQRDEVARLKGQLTAVRDVQEIHRCLPPQLPTEELRVRDMLRDVPATPRRGSVPDKPDKPQARLSGYPDY